MGAVSGALLSIGRGGVLDIPVPDGSKRPLSFLPPSLWLPLNASRLCMESPTTSLTSTATSVFESATAVPEIAPNDSVPAHHANPAVAFIIGLAIILLASVLNAAGLNLTKLDHVSSSPHSCWLLAVSEWRFRCGRVRYRSRHDDETGYDRYGCSECYCTCE